MMTDGQITIIVFFAYAVFFLTLVNVIVSIIDLIIDRIDQKQDAPYRKQKRNNKTGRWKR